MVADFSLLFAAWPQLPVTAALALVALIGYIVGRRSRVTDQTLNARAQREIERAQAVAQQLEQIAKAVSNHVARHHALVARFKDRVNDLDSQQRGETWQRLCAEAEEILRPTLQLANEFANAYDQLRQQTQHLMTFSDVRIDPLTGTQNRRALDESLETLLALRNRYNQPFSLAIFDIDHFKQINDDHGHLSGDRALKAVATLLRGCGRETDAVYRYGGEEFVVVMPQTELEAASQFADRVRRSVRESNTAGMALTVSGGVASPADGEDKHDLLDRADQAMYAAKHAGRDQVFLHSGTAVEPVQPLAEVAI